MLLEQGTPQPVGFTCPACDKSYRIDRSLLPPQGARITCKRCRRAFLLTPPKAHGPSVWLLTGDPAIGHPAVQQALATVGYLCTVEALGPTEREERRAALVAGTARPPTALVFGDMHVLLADPLLQHLAKTPGTARFRVATHDNAELTAAAQAFCDIDHQWSMPAPQAALTRVIQKTLDDYTRLTHPLA